MRRLALNLFTSVAAVALLIGLSVSLARVLQAGFSQATTQLLPSPSRTFGVYTDPWHVDEWSNAVGASPQMLAKFEAFSRRRTIDDFLGETERRGVRQVLVSWEPWEPVPASLGTTVQFLPQVGYRNAEIARGVQDAYIRQFAASLAKFDGVVWLRYAHEMNGIWYPWSHGPRNYRRAWRHVVNLVRAAGATNVRFVWSANLNLYESPATWMRKLRQYWPGAGYVDAVGSTMINFGGAKEYPVGRFVPRLRTLHDTFRKPVVLSEVNTEHSGRVVWLRHLRRMLNHLRWIRAVAWSQLPSRGTAQMQHAGRLDWDVQDDPPAAAQLRAIIADGVP